MRLSVVIPVFNEPEQLAATIRSVSAEIGASTFGDAEIVVADDGSNVEIEAPALAAASTVPVRVERLARNSGRFEARRAGLTSARGDYVLFVDAGVTIEPGSLAFVARALDEGRDVWNAHTILNTAGNPFGLFWSVVNSVAFGDYVDAPRDTSFGAEDFDRFPKGTTCFFAPRALLVEVFTTFRSRYADTRYANDDGPIIRTIAGRRPINIAPGFACVYTPRSTMRSFVKHALHRGIVFVDGHGRPESRFFPVVVAFFPLSLGAGAVSVRRPVFVPLLAAGIAVVAAATALERGRTRAETLSFGALAPVYAAAHGAGMWRGAGLALARRLTR